MRRKLEDAGYWRRGHAQLVLQTKPKLEPATSSGIILPETGQFLLLCLLQLWQQLQRCHQTHARVPLFFDTFDFHSAETVHCERHVS